MIVNDVGFFGKFPVISPTTQKSVLPTGEEEGKSTDITGGFADALKESWQAGQELSDAAKVTTTQLMTGELDDLSGHLIAQEKSSMMFEYNLQVRNKLLDAYQEVIKTQI